MISSFSHSSLGCYRNCPRQFKFKYIDKVSVEPKILANTYLGSAVHRALKQLYTLGADNILYPQSDIVDFYYEQWNKLNRENISISSEHYTVDDYIRIGRDILVKYYEKHQPFNEGTLLGAEIRLNYNLPDSPYKFVCYIDRLWKRDDGVVEICDYKTGQALIQPDSPAFLFQMGLYQLAVQQSYPQFINIELAQYLLRKDEIVSCKMKPDKLEQLKEMLRSEILDIYQAVRLNNFSPKESSLCNFCDYYNLCPAKIHRKMLDDEDQTEQQDLQPQKLKELADLFIHKKNQSIKIKNELDGVRAQLIEIAREHDITGFEGDEGKVNVSLVKNEEFITKTADSKAFAELNFLSRQLNLDNYFVVDARSLMKEVYRKKQLPEDKLKELEKFVVLKEKSRVIMKLKHQSNDDENIV